MLLIRQLIIVAVRRVLGEVLHEFPIVAFGIIEVPTLAVRMCVGRRGLSKSGRLHSLAQCLNIVYFVSKMIHARKAPVRCPGFLGLRVRWTQGNVGFIGAHVNPSGAVPTFAFAAHPKLRKRCLQETDHLFDIMYTKVRMLKPNSHAHLPCGTRYA